MILFPMALFLATTFPEIVKNSIFLLNFYQNFLKISYQCIFLPHARKISAWFVNFFEKYAKIQHFCDLLKKPFEIFRKFSGVLGEGSALLTPTGRPPKVFPPNRNLDGAADTFWVCTTTIQICNRDICIRSFVLMQEIQVSQVKSLNRRISYLELEYLSFSIQYYDNAQEYISDAKYQERPSYCLLRLPLTSPWQTKTRKISRGNFSVESPQNFKGSRIYASKNFSAFNMSTPATDRLNFI